MSKAKPFLKWVGGKRRLVPELLKRVPKEFDWYVEPFVGSGALFFALGIDGIRAILNDVNLDLIATYVAVRSYPLSIYEELRRIENSESVYYKIRQEFNERVGAPQVRAARFIYLNKAGYNGLYRVISKGKFNVPYGRRRLLGIPLCDDLVLAANALRYVALSNVDLVNNTESIISRIPKQASKKTFIYLDPPYYRDGGKDSFTGYSATPFDALSHEMLAARFRLLDNRGFKLMMSNSDHEFIRKLYDGYRIEEVTTARSVAADATKRGKVTELIIRNY